MKSSVGFRLSPEMILLLEDKQIAPERTRALEALIADGLRYRMSVLSPKPISRRILLTATPEQVLEMWFQYDDAVSTECGVKGILGNQFVLKECPAGSIYAEPGKSVFMVVGKDETYTPINGVQKNEV